MVANEFVRGGDFVKNSKILGPLCLEANGLFKEVIKKKKKKPIYKGFVSLDSRLL